MNLLIYEIGSKSALTLTRDLTMGTETTGSKKFSLNKEDVLSITKGAGLAGAGGVLAYLAVSVLPNLDLGDLAWLAPLLAIVLNAGRKWITDNSK